MREQDAVADATRSAPAAAERASAAILSYGYQSLDADEKAAERYMTSAYKKKYADTFDRLVRPNAPRSRPRWRRRSRPPGSRTPTPTGSTCCSTSTSPRPAPPTAAEPQVALNRVRLSMVEVDGAWLVDDITSY